MLLGAYEIIVALAACVAFSISYSTIQIICLRAGIW